jgi:hypothetical protein
VAQLILVLSLPWQCATLPLHVQIANTTELRLSNRTREGIPEFVQAVADTAIRMGYLHGPVPRPYVALGENLEAWARELRHTDTPPVRIRAEVDARILKCPELRHQDEVVITRALKFLAAGGAVVLADEGRTVVLDQGWLANTLACVITADPVRLRVLPAALTQRGILRHDQETLAVVWPDHMGYTRPLRRTLLTMMHDFCLLFKVCGAEDSTGYSLVPSMLPPDECQGTQTLDQAIGCLVSGQKEVGVEYHLAFVPLDFWPSVVVWCAALVVPETCTRTSAVLQWGGQRGRLTLNISERQLTFVARGTTPEELRVRFHWAVVELARRKYPNMTTNDSLHAVCHECHRPSQLFGKPLRKVLEKGKFVCTHCERPLTVSDLVVSPLDAVKTALTAGVTDPAKLCVLAARLVDTARELCDDHGHRSQLWLPIVSVVSGAGGEAGAGSGAASGLHGHVLGWAPVCEDPHGWHVVPCDPVVGDTRLSAVGLDAVAPVLHHVAAVLCAVSGVADVAASTAKSRDWLVSPSPDVTGSADWVEFCKELVMVASRSTAVGVRLRLQWHDCVWKCQEHTDVGVSDLDQVRRLGVVGVVSVCAFVACCRLCRVR